MHNQQTKAGFLDVFIKRMYPNEQIATNARDDNSMAKWGLALYGFKSAYSDNLGDQKNNMEKTQQFRDQGKKTTLFLLVLQAQKADGQRSLYSGFLLLATFSWPVPPCQVMQKSNILNLLEPSQFIRPSCALIYFSELPCGKHPVGQAAEAD